MRRHSLQAAVLIGTMSLATTVAAEITRRTDEGFNSVHEVFMPVSADEAYRAFGDMPAWWDPLHTYTGDSDNLSLSLEPGGCFCERSGPDGVEHGRVIMAWPRGPSRIVRLQGAFGPLQGLTTEAILTLEAIPQADGGSMVRMVYVVRGEEAARFADPVDHVMAGQFARLVEHLGGKATPAPPPVAG
ncbi:hypothetical protein [Brevundimonas sp.]|uniref:hypothetical protein n=1 Tax=Brevundimonas sp. TaxID=1871086 RepID=UPI002D4F07AD|nr:hypothetical protein [Brevundimonas sp.]HYD28383.1 hypothetical protein [Brevundimonas sp.]